MTLDTNAILVKSPFTQVCVDGKLSVIWHSLFGFPKIIPAETLEFLELFSEPTTIRQQLGEVITAEDQQALEELLNGYFLVPEGFDDRKFLEEKNAERDSEIMNGSLINFLELIMSEACNFACTYCIHFGNLGSSDRLKNQNKLMKFDTARKTVDSYLGILSRHQKTIAEINFGGGEPLLAWSTIKEVLEYCHVVYGSQFEFHFSLNTNASLISREIAEVLKEHHVEIATSLDGLQQGNDRVRLTK